MGVGRHFTSLSGGFGSGTGGDYLLSPTSSDSYIAFTFSAWVKQDYPFPNQRAGLAGRLFDFHNGWAVFISPDQRLTFFATGNPVDDPSQFQSVSCPFFDNWTYIAITYDSAGGANNVKFYWGDTTDNFILRGTGTRTGTFTELSAYGLMFGNATFGELLTGGPVVNWNGSLSKIGLRTQALTIEQLKSEMQCNPIRAPGIKYLVDIAGINPEPSIEGGASSAGPFTIRGTYVDSAPDWAVGCDYQPEDYPYTRYLNYYFLAPLSEIAEEAGGGNGGGEAVCAPFRIFWQDSNVSVHGWADSLAYQVIRPFGGPHQTPPSGAEI